MSSVFSATPGPLKKRIGPRREKRQQTADMAELDSPDKNTRRKKGNTTETEKNSVFWQYDCNVKGNFLDYLL